MRSFIRFQRGPEDWRKQGFSAEELEQQQELRALSQQIDFLNGKARGIN